MACPIFCTSEVVSVALYSYQTNGLRVVAMNAISEGGSASSSDTGKVRRQPVRCRLSRHGATLSENLEAVLGGPKRRVGHED